VYEAPEGLAEIEYRLVLDGLWTTDPANPLSRRDRVSGIANSLVIMPQAKKEPVLRENPKGILNFSFKGPPGETVTVAGSFNHWDPFMYELEEYPEGVYTLSLSLPPGTYQYLFFHRGERYLDPYNFRRAYTREGDAASEVVIE
jgi:1,4-alpha-glucan branching enzyme